MAGGKPGVMIYFETGRAIKKLDYEAKGRLLEAILEYAESKTEPTFDTSTQNGFVLDAMWPLICDKIDRDSERYTQVTQKKIIAGITSDFKRNYAPKHGIDTDNEDELRKYINLRLSTGVGNCQPTTSESVTGTVPTTTSESAIKGIRDNVEMEKGLTLTSQPVDSDSEDRNLSFADRKRQAMEMLSGRM